MVRTKPISTIKWGFPYYAPDKKRPSPYLYQIDLIHEIGPGILFHDSCVKIAHAHRKHPDGNRYVCYGTWVGPGLVWLLYPMENENGVSDLLSNERALLETADKENNDPLKVIRDLDSTMINDKKWILKYSPETSNLLEDVSEGPYDYIYYILVKTNDSIFKNDFKEYLQQFIAANQKNDKGFHWITYLSEDKNNQYAHIYVPMRKFADMDQWTSFINVLKNYNNEQASLIRNTLFAGITDIETHIMTFVPSCDNSGFEFDE